LLLPIRWHHQPKLKQQRTGVVQGFAGCTFVITQQLCHHSANLVQFNFLPCSAGADTGIMVSWHRATLRLRVSATEGVIMRVCRFNLRVLECRMAAMLLAHLLPASLGTVGGPTQELSWQHVTILKQVEQHLLQFAAANSSSTAAAAELLVWAVQQLLPEATYTLQQVCAS
jgi:hypothetical protein